MYMILSQILSSFKMIENKAIYLFYVGMLTVPKSTLIRGKLNNLDYIFKRLTVFSVNKNLKTYF